MKRVVFLLSITTILFNITVNSQNIKNIVGIYSASIDSTIVNQNQNQLKDTFAFADLQEHFVPLDNNDNGEYINQLLTIIINDNNIVLKDLKNQIKISFSRKDIQINGNKYIITPKQGEKIILENKGDYLKYSRGTNHFKLHKRK
jgi:hypothetical protein